MRSRVTCTLLADSVGDGGMGGGAGDDGPSPILLRERRIRSAALCMFPCRQPCWRSHYRGQLPQRVGRAGSSPRLGS